MVLRYSGECMRCGEVFGRICARLYRYLFLVLLIVLVLFQHNGIELSVIGIIDVLQQDNGDDLKFMGAK